MKFEQIGSTFIIPPLVESLRHHRVCRQIFENDAIHPDDKRPFNLLPITSEPNMRSVCPEFQQVQLPISYCSDSHVTKNSLLLVYEWFTTASHGTMVFAFDICNYQLYHLVTKKEHEKCPFFALDSYAAVDNLLYFVGGNYPNHDVHLTVSEAFRSFCYRTDVGKTWEDRHSKAKSIDEIKRKKNLEVKTFNLDTCKFEDSTSLTKFNLPKPNPIVFTFDKKIYALSGREPFGNLGDGFPSFEFLDTKYTSKLPATWTSLPPPPFLVEEDSRHILWEEKHCLFVKVSDGPAKKGSILLWMFDIESEKWYNDSANPSNPYHDPKSSVFLRSLSNVPTKHFEGCIFRDILFYFEDDDVNPEVRLLVGHDLRGEKVICRRWEIDLKESLGCVGQRSLSTKFLSHMTGNKFCLAIEYKPAVEWFVNFLCICLFKLEFSEEAQNLHISLAVSGCHYFQMPNHALLTYQAKLEGERSRQSTRYLNAARIRRAQDTPPPNDEVKPDDEMGIEEPDSWDDKDGDIEECEMKDPNSTDSSKYVPEVAIKDKGVQEPIKSSNTPQPSREVGKPKQPANKVQRQSKAGTGKSRLG